MIDVKNRWALITGASRGLGKELALFMAKQGCHLILQARSEKALDSVQSEANTLGVKTIALAAELSDEQSIKQMLKAIDKTGHRIDFVFNNAGVQVAYRSNIYDTPVSDYMLSCMINTVAPMLICYHFIPKMVEHGFGRVLNTTSGIDKDPYQAGYSASKAALDKVTKDIGTTLKDTGVTINLVDPGWCRTDLGGPNAPNSVESTIPGTAVGAFLEDDISGRIIHVQEYKGMSLEEAVASLTLI